MIQKTCSSCKTALSLVHRPGAMVYNAASCQCFKFSPYIPLTNYYAGMSIEEAYARFRGRVSVRPDIKRTVLLRKQVYLIEEARHY